MPSLGALFPALLWLDLTSALDVCETGLCPGDFGSLLQVNLQIRRARNLPTSYYKQSLANHGDVQYVGNISLGEQVLQGVMDTGSYELLAFSTDCFTCGLASRYSHRASLTYAPGKLMKTTAYGSGSAMAIDGTDDLAIGPFTVKAQPFWEAMSARMPVLFSATFQAIVALGPPGEPQAEASAMIKEAEGMLNQTFLPDDLAQSLRKQMEAAQLVLAKKDSLLQNLGVRYFSACLAWESGAPGYIIWNDLPPLQQRAPFKQLTVVGKMRWSVVLSSASFNSRNGSIQLGCSQGCEAILDTGTSLLAVPTTVYNAALSQLRMVDADCMNVGEMPDLVITLGDHEYSLPPQTYVSAVTGVPPRGSEVWFPRRGNGSFCELLLMDSGTLHGNFGPVWIIGMPFFRYYYTTFDLGADPLDPTSRKIWTAPASQDCEPAAEHKHVQQFYFAKSQLRAWTINASLLRTPHGLEHSSESNMSSIRTSFRIGRDERAHLSSTQ